MPANTEPIFTLTPNIGMAEVAEANAESDGTGDLVTLFTAGANGSRVEYVKYTNAQSTPAASSAMVVRIFVTDSGGINPRLIGESALATATRTVAVIGATGTITFSGGLTIASGQLLQCCQSVYAGVQDLMHFIAVGGDY